MTAEITTPIVTAAGDFQSELGCPADFSPNCLRSWLTDVDGDGIYTFTTTAIPAGDYAVKAAIGLSWDVNYGAGGVANGPDIPFTVGKNGSPTTFSYNSTSHVLTISATAGPPNITAPKAYWLSRSVIAWSRGHRRHPLVRAVRRTDRWAGRDRHRHHRRHQDPRSCATRPGYRPRSRPSSRPRTIWAR